MINSYKAIKKLKNLTSNRFNVEDCNQEKKLNL